MQDCLTGFIVISVILGLCAGYAYLLNQRYGYSDSERGNYKLGAVFLAPFTWPFLLVAGLILTVVKAILFGILLVIFTLAAILFRKPFFWPMVEPLIIRIGRKLLGANTRFLDLFAKDS